MTVTVIPKEQSRLRAQAAGTTDNAGSVDTSTSDSIIDKTPNTNYRQDYLDRLRTFVPSELRQRDQWVLWRIEERDGRQTKIPYQPNGDKADNTAPATWGGFETIAQAYERGGFDFVGFVFSPVDPYCGVDLDHCIVDDVVEPRRAAWVEMLDSYSEFSQSGTGIHIITRAPHPGKRKKDGALGVEIYDRARGFVFTGDHVPGTPRTINERQTEVAALYVEVFGEDKPEPAVGRRAPAPVDLDDHDLWDHMFTSKNGLEIRALFDGVVSFQRADGTADHSSADLALCSHLAFWTGRDADRMDRMFRQTGLYRVKWERADYRERTINKAIDSTTETYRPRIYTNGDRPHEQPPDWPDDDWTPADEDAPPADQVPAPATEFLPHWTDLGNAARMYALARDRAFYVPAFGKWYLWADTHWREDTTLAIYRLAKEVIRSMYREAASIEDDKDRKEFAKWIRQSESRNRLDAMIALVRSEPGMSLSPDELDREPMMLPCANGTIDLRTGELLPPNPAHRFTKAIDVAYDPKAECPLFENFLSRIMGGSFELVCFLQRLIGHALTGDATGKYLVFLYGPKGNNGKSTLVETITRLLGPYALKSPSEMVMSRSHRGTIPNDIARLRGVRFTVTNEVDEGMKLSESVVKDLTGNDTLTARFMRGEFFDFRPSHKLWVYGNQQPEIRGTDAAIWDRVCLIPFEVEIPESERDPQMPEKLARELPGILAWAVRGCLYWQMDGLKRPDLVKQATGAYRTEQDMIGQFIEDCASSSACRPRRARNSALSSGGAASSRRAP